MSLPRIKTVSDSKSSFSPDEKREEFEAEAVCYLVCDRLGIENPSAEYLNGYLDENREVPPISLERVFVAANLVEQMGKRLLALR